MIYLENLLKEGFLWSTMKSKENGLNLKMMSSGSSVKNLNKNTITSKMSLIKKLDMK